jgi:hypothetical protein
MANTPTVMYRTTRGTTSVDEMDIGYVYNASKFIVRKHGRSDLQDSIQAADMGTARLILKWLLLHHKEEYENSYEYHIKLWNSLPEKFKSDGNHPHPDELDEYAYDYYDNRDYIVNKDRVTVEKLLQKCCDFVHLYRYPNVPLRNKRRYYIEDE